MRPLTFLKIPPLKVSWAYFVLAVSLFVVLMNFNLFSYLYSNIDFKDNPLLFLSLPLIFFGLVLSVFSLAFLPYFSKPLSILIILSTCLSAFFMSNYGIIIDSDMIRNVVKTDAKEVGDLFNAKLLLFVVCLGILPTLLILGCKIEYFGFKAHLKHKLLLLSFGLVLAFGFFLIQTKTLIPYFRNNPQARVYNAPFYQFYSVAKYFKQDFSKQPTFLTLSENTKLKNPQEKKLLILVVGETARAANYSLGSYTRNSVNEYTEQKDITYFNNFYSCGTSTAISVPCMFSFNPRKDFKTSEFQENVLDVLQNIGVNVVWLDNNYGSCQGVCKRLSKVKQFDGGYDVVLFEEFIKDLPTLEGNNLYILHLQGSHGPAYYKRYPDNFRRFTPTCDTNELSKCTQEEILNTYDNTLYYTDWIIAELVDIAAEVNDYTTAVLYLSDHGESLGENGIYLHGMPYALAPQEQIHIPSIAYHNNATINARLKQHKDFKLSHDNLAHSLLGFFGVESPLYKESYDIFSDSLKENP